MTIRQRLEEFWRGGRPASIPYTIYYWSWKDVQTDPGWNAMYSAGLGVTHHLGPTRESWQEVQVENFQTGTDRSRQILHTPVGKLTSSTHAGWHDEYLLKTAADYRVMTWIVKNTVVEPGLDQYRHALAELPAHAVPLLQIGRTPLQEILVDYAGLENFAVHLYEFESEVRELYAALLTRFRKRVAIAAQAPGTFVSNLENFTAESLGPHRFTEFLLPVYRECFPILQAAGKIVGCHFDGRTAACREVIAHAPIDLIESLTEPPEGDQTIAECRQVWPDKLFWINIGVSCYQLPRAELRDKIWSLYKAGARDGRLVAFQVSEDLPTNWRTSMPMVIEILQEISQAEKHGLKTD